MTLREWLFKQRLSITFFAALMKVDRSYVHRWMKGSHIPSPKIMDRIREISMDQINKYKDLKDVKVKRTAPTKAKKDQGNENLPVIGRDPIVLPDSWGLVNGEKF